MSKQTRPILLSIAMLAISAAAPLAFAAVDLKSSVNSVMVIPAEGNGRCSDYAANSFVKEMSTSFSCPSSGGSISGKVVGPDSVHSELDPVSGVDPNTTQESATWEYNCNTNELSVIDSTIGLNFVVTKASKNITWFPYGKLTFRKDQEIANQDPTTGNVLRMASFALCYDLNGATQFVKPEALPECNGAVGDVNEWLGAINCTAAADGTVVTLWRPKTVEIDGIATVIGDELYQCVCNDGLGVLSTISCDPSGQSADLQACYSKEIGQPKATTVLEFDADPITCTTSGGTRTCKCVDNPFIAGNDCLVTQ